MSWDILFVINSDRMEMPEESVKRRQKKAHIEEEEL